MKFTKKRGYKGSLCKVWSDDKEVCFGVVGTVGDLLRERILEYADYPQRIGEYVDVQIVRVEVGQADVSKEVKVFQHVQRALHGQECV